MIDREFLRCLWVARAFHTRRRAVSIATVDRGRDKTIEIDPALPGVRQSLDTLLAAD
ncbi:MAG: hypothetical protein ACRDRN_02610 [Sciscionella sp.]